jgi:hypothetical protein
MTRRCHHDALNAKCRNTLACCEFGSHHGVPVSVVVTATLQDLQAGAGKAGTGGGTWLPISDVIRMADHAWQYLAVFDTHTRLPPYLGRTKRIASAGQRIVLHAKDRGCTFAGCKVPGYLCEVHSLEDWAAGGRTDIDKLTFSCKTHHTLLEQDWKTRKLFDGTTEWIPPPHLDTGQPRTNKYHHPERYLSRQQDDGDSDWDEKADLAIGSSRDASGVS